MDENHPLEGAGKKQESFLLVRKVEVSNFF